jgi:uncharacterized membrane protein YhaH (DUF805 family)
MLRPLGKLATFSGRSDRMAFWPYMVLLALLYLCGMAATFGGVAAFHVILPAMFILAGLLVVLAYAAVVRRMHDVGWSGWWMTAYVVLVWIFIGSAFAFRASAEAGNAGAMLIVGLSTIFNLAQSGLALLIFVVCCFGSSGPNRFGAVPIDKVVPQ